MVRSKYCKPLENNSFEDAFTCMPQNEMDFIEQVLIYLKDNRNKFLQNMQSIDDFNDFDDPKLVFSTKYAGLVITLARNYEVILI